MHVFDFILSDSRFLRASVIRNDDGSCMPVLSEIMNTASTQTTPLLSPVPCETGSGQYEAFIQLLGVVQWKAVITNVILDTIQIKQGVDEVFESTLERIISHFAPGVKLIRVMTTH